MNRIYLIGYMGAGKTTLGAPLAKALGLSFVDLDLFIENRYHKSVNEIFTQMGEDRFRKIEQIILKEVSNFENVVISTGGGTPCFFDNMELMNSSGVTIYLDVSIEKLFQRLVVGKWKRPKLKDKLDEELFAIIKEGLQFRLPFYNRAQIIHSGEELESQFSIDKSVEHLVKLIGAS